MIRTTLLAVYLLLCTFNSSVPCRAAEKNEARLLAKGNNQFAVDLYKQVSKEKNNMFFSPYSISTALAMTYAGAKGQTEQEMRKTLKFPFGGEQLHKSFGTLIGDLNNRSKSGNYQLNVANRIWIAIGENINKTFKDLVNTNYGAGAERLDFIAQTEKSRQTINKWVEDKTNEKIKDLIPKGGVNAGTSLVLTNAIYFLGNWESQFEAEMTHEADFNVTADKKVKVPMMTQTKRFEYGEFEGFKALSLPYKGRELSLVVLLPDRIDGIRELEKKLSAENINNWVSSLNQEQVSVFFPKFKMTSEFGLARTMSQMGMPSAFTPRADFSGMGQGLFISEIFHKAFVDVDEKGTEAAAATGVVMTKSMYMGQTYTFRADRPFIFMIKDNKTGSILFMGRMMNPAE
jgi:serine protease inhibitor